MEGKVMEYLKKCPICDSPLEEEESLSIEDKICYVTECLQEVLIAKNQNYGNSALRSPVLLPDLPAEKAIFVRMSDKVARLAQLTSGEKDRVGESIEDTLLDLAGYCILGIIAMEEDSK